MPVGRGIAWSMVDNGNGREVDGCGARGAV